MIDSRVLKIIDYQYSIINELSIINHQFNWKFENWRLIEN